MSLFGYSSGKNPRLQPGVSGLVQPYIQNIPSNVEQGAETFRDETSELDARILVSDLRSVLQRNPNLRSEDLSFIRDQLESCLLLVSSTPPYDESMAQAGTNESSSGIEANQLQANKNPYGASLNPIESMFAGKPIPDYRTLVLTTLHKRGSERSNKRTMKRKETRRRQKERALEMHLKDIEKY